MDIFDRLIKPAELRRRAEERSKLEAIAMMPPPTQMTDPLERYLALRVNLMPQNPIVNVLNPPAVTAEIGLKTTLPQSCRGACNI